MVVVTHVWPAQSFWWGIYAVYCFFLVSGFLMTLVLERTYPYSSEGLSRYAVNRVLRIYPAYLLVCALALVLIDLLPDVAFNTSHKLRWPDTTGRWLANFFIFGLLRDNLSLVPPAWSLNLELVYYVAMGLLLSRGRIVITLWFGASCAYTIYLLATEPSFGPRYASILGASLPFALGAMLYSYRHRLEWIAGWTALVSAPLFLLNVALAAWHPLASQTEGHFYVSLLLGAFLLSALSRLRPGDFPVWWQRLDRLGGNLSYPIFLCHLHVAAIVAWLAFDGVKVKDSGIMWASTFLLTNLVGYVIYLAVDRNIDGLRDRVRQRRSARGDAHGIVDS